MNTLIKLQTILASRGLNLFIRPPEEGTDIWTVRVGQEQRSAVGTGTLLETATEQSLLNWVASMHTGDPLPDLTEDRHTELPGHHDCGQRRCHQCGARPRADESGWTQCTTLLCPSCRSDAEEIASKRKHSASYYADLDYPVTIYQDEHGRLIAECRDLPGCVVESEHQQRGEDEVALPLPSVQRAYDLAKRAGKQWIDQAARRGRIIPLPSPVPETD